MNAIEYENTLVNVLPSTVTGMFTVPLAVFMLVVTVKVITGAIVPLLATLAVMPVGRPDIVPTVAATCVAPLYAITLQGVEPANAAAVEPAKACDSLPSNIV